MAKVVLDKSLKGALKFSGYFIPVKSISKNWRNLIFCSAYNHHIISVTPLSYNSEGESLLCFLLHPHNLGKTLKKYLWQCKRQAVNETYIFITLVKFCAGLEPWYAAINKRELQWRINKRNAICQCFYLKELIIMHWEQPEQIEGRKVVQWCNSTTSMRLQRATD